MKKQISTKEKLHENRVKAHLKHFLRKFYLVMSTFSKFIISKRNIKIYIIGEVILEVICFTQWNRSELCYTD